MPDAHIPLGQRRAVLSCLHYWGSPIQVASHHVARAMAGAGWEAAYLSAPLTPLHLLKLGRENVAERWRLHRSGGARDLEGRLWAWAPLALLAPDNRPLLRSGPVLGAWPWLTVPGLRRTLAEQGFDRPDLLYLDNFYHAALARLLRPRRTVYHAADVYSAFPGYGRAFARAEAALVRDADLVCFPSRDMEQGLRAMGARRLLFLPNGLDYAHFAAPRPEPAEYAAIPAPRAVYVGALDVWFDYALLERTARENPEVSFVLVGPDHLARRRLPPLPNLHLLGPRGRAVVPAFLQHAQVGVIPFDVAGYPELIHPVRPLKLLEYMAAGLPVVSTAWRELRTMDSPAALCESAADFSRAVARAAAGELPSGDSVRAFAQGNDWAGILSRFLEAL